MVGRSAAVLVGLVSLTAAGALFLLSQTVVGRNAAAELVESALKGTINGEVRLGPIIGGNLLSRAHLAHFEIVEADGTPFLSLDSVRVEYNPLGLLIGVYRFRNVTVERARLELRQHDDGSWNFDRLFGDDEPPPHEADEQAGEEEGPPGDERLLLHDVVIRTGTLRVRTPWARELRGAARDLANAAGLRGERLWRVRRIGPDRVERELVLDSLRGGFPLIRLIDRARPMRFEFSEVATAASVVTQPLDVKRFDGAAVFRDTITVDIDGLQTTNSAISGRGWIVPSDPVQFAFDLEADPIGFADLQWLPIPVPTTGGGPASVDLWTRGEVIVVDAGDGDVRVDDSRMTGSFSIALDRTPRFESLDVTLRPVRLALVDELLDREPLIDGYLRGPVTGTGPIDLVNIDADLEVVDLDGGEEPSRVLVRGGVSIGEPKEMSGLEITFSEFEPRWTKVIGIATPVIGRTAGTATFTGFMGGPFDFEADLYHRQPGASDSHVSGGGMVDLSQRRSVNVQLTADPLALPVLEPVMAELGREVDLVGDVRGPVSASGALSDLRIVADLRTPRGLVNFDGRFDVESQEKTYDATLVARDVQLRQWIERGPATRLAVEGRVRGRGTDPATLEATFDLTLLRSLVEGAQVDSSLLRFTVAEGLATADTFAIRTDAGRIDGRGSFGLAHGTSGSLILDIDASDLSAWNRWIVPGRNPARQDTSVEALFEAFPEPGQAVERPEEPAEVPDTLSGSLSGLGVLYGNVHGYSLGGRMFMRNAGFGEIRADSAQLTVDVLDPYRLSSMEARVAAWGVTGYQGRADTLAVRWKRAGPEDHEVDLFARRDSTLEVATSGSLRWAKAAREVFVESFRATLGEQSLDLTGPAFVSYGNTGFVARGINLSGEDGALIEIQGVVPDSGIASLSFRMRDIRLEDVLQLPVERPDLGGTVDLELDLSGTADSPRWTARLDIRDPAVFGIGYEVFRGEFHYGDRRIDVATSLRAEGTELGRVDGHILADLTLRAARQRLLADPLHLTVVADSVPLEPLELAFESLRDVTGFTRGRVDVTGRPGRLMFDGSAIVTEAGATVPYLGIRFEGIEGHITFVSEEARIDSLRLASSAGGTGSLAGVVGIAELTNPRFGLTFETRRFGAMDRRMARFLLNGQGALGGSYRAPELIGAFRITEGEIRTERFILQRQAVDLTDPDVYALVDTTLVMEQRLFERAQNPFMRNLRADLLLSFGPNLWLRSDALDVEVLGDLDVRMDRAQEDIVAFGTLQLPRGKYRYIAGAGSELSSLYSRQLKITGGTVTFVGTPGVDPNLDITAEYETRTDLGPVTITVNVRGTSLDPTMETSSDPPLPAADEVCYLLFSAACVGAGNQGGEFAASLVREGLLGTVSNQFSQVLVSGVGLVDYFDIRSTGYGPALESGQTTTNLLYGTEIEIGRYLTPDLFVRATQPIGGQLPGFSAEWTFHPRWSLEFITEDRFKRHASYGYSFSSFSDRTWGLMLFREWIF